MHDQTELKYSSVSFHSTGLIFTRICLWIVTRPSSCFLEFLTMAIKGGEIIFKISFKIVFDPAIHVKMQHRILISLFPQIQL